MKHHRFGYTLLELLISLSILIVLVGLLWGMIDMFSRLFIKGELRAERSQLVRSLSQILEEDLSAAIQDPVHPFRDQLTDAEITRRFGLFGTSNSLRIDVVQINPFKTKDFDNTTNREAPELKTVYYDFTPPETAQNMNEPGLLRREIDFETPTGSDSSSPPPEMTGSTDLPTLGDVVEQKRNQTVSAAVSPQDHEKMTAPEVIGCRFSYFDGQNWLDSWDSLQQNGLPAAIEVNLRLLPLSEAQKLRVDPHSDVLRNVIDQRIVVRVPSTPLKKQMELKRDQPVKVDPPKKNSMIPPDSTPAPPPRNVVPAEKNSERNWIRQ